MIAEKLIQEDRVIQLTNSTKRPKLSVVKTTRKMLLGSYTVERINEQGELETRTFNVPDEIY